MAWDNVVGAEQCGLRTGRVTFETLTPAEQDIILRCMRAVVEYIDDWEKHTRLGLTPEQLQAIIRPVAANR